MYLDMRKKLDDYMALNNVKICSEVYNCNMIKKPWDQPVPEDQWFKVIEYCDNDVIATEAAFNHLIKSMPKSSPHITKVIFNNPATIVMWSDGSKTVVKAGKDDIFDPEKGLAMAIVKKALGNTGKYYNEIKKWLPNE